MINAITNKSYSNPNEVKGYQYYRPRTIHSDRGDGNVGEFENLYIEFREHVRRSDVKGKGKGKDRKCEKYETIMWFEDGSCSAPLYLAFRIVSGNGAIGGKWILKKEMYERDFQLLHKRFRKTRKLGHFGIRIGN
jgi:hypothetical protein